MNREEAIYFANCLKNNYTVDLNDMEAFCDMAIKALAQEPTTKNNLGVEEVTALAEWTEKLTKASEEAYSKGYADGMKAQAEPKTKIEESNFSREQYALDIDTAWKCGYEAGKKENAPVNICPHCGEYIGEEE